MRVRLILRGDKGDDEGISIRGRFGLDGPSWRSTGMMGVVASDREDEVRGETGCCQSGWWWGASSQAAGAAWTSGASVGILGVADGSRWMASVSCCWVWSTLGRSSMSAGSALRFLLRASRGWDSLGQSSMGLRGLDAWVGEGGTMAMGDHI